MLEITLRRDKGEELTHDEMDINLSMLAKSKRFGVNSNLSNSYTPEIDKVMLEDGSYILVWAVFYSGMVVASEKNVTFVVKTDLDGNRYIQKAKADYSDDVIELSVSNIPYDEELSIFDIRINGDYGVDGSIVGTIEYYSRDEMLIQDSSYVEIEEADPRIGDEAN